MNEKDRLNAIEPDLRAIVAQLKGQTYLFGHNPCGADAAVGPVLAMIANMPKPTPLSERVRADDQIMAYVNAVTNTQFQNKALQNISANPQ
ncbi:MAG: glutathione S-transferase C-terminal domain-containing protein [Paracoccaceae bacterium]